jgi:hypothetical protein
MFGRFGKTTLPAETFPYGIRAVRLNFSGSTKTFSAPTILRNFSTTSGLEALVAARGLALK